jgi:glutaminase
MHSPTSIAGRSEEPYISTGHLPDPALVQRLGSETHARFKSNTEGQNSQVYPALARVPSDLFGVCVVDTSGRAAVDGRTNPMVNAGAIATTSLVPGATEEEKWTFIHAGLSRFAGRTLPLNDGHRYLRLPDDRPGELPAGPPSRR